MKIDKRSGSDERKLLIAMIVDEHFLSKMVDRWTDEGLFKSKWSNLIGKWCVRHYKKYEKAPGKQIENIFTNWTKGQRDEESVKLIDKFLAILSDEYAGHEEEINTQYTQDVAQRYFNEVKLVNLVDTVQDYLDSNKVNEALSAVVTHETVEVGLGVGTDVLEHRSAVEQALNESYNTLIHYPGAAGQFLGQCMYREGFVAFMGPEKRGKSFFLMDAAFRALSQRKKVAYFEAGDNSENEVIRRMCCRISRRPLKKKTIQYPVDLWEHDGVCVTEMEDRKVDKDLSWQVAWKAMEKLKKRKIKSKHSFFKLSAHANSTLSVRDIESILQTWEKDDWVPDVIIIDYADILRMDCYGVEGRDRINETWKHMRALSQKWHALVLTATQADASSYSAELITRSNFSDDKRKLAHITAMIGLNQTEDEKDDQAMRLNYVALRSGAYSEGFCVYVANCLAIANPIVKSCFKEMGDE